MSIKLIEFAKKFSGSELSANEFSSPYIKMWVEERNLNLLKDDAPNISECASDIFMLADIYNPEPDREDYEIDETQLREKVKEALTKFNLQ